MSELSLRENGVQRITYGNEVNEAVQTLAQAWEEFRLLPLEEKQKLATSNLFDGVGYESKINDSISKDRKENFDFALDKGIGYQALRRLHISYESINLIKAFEDVAKKSRTMLESFWFALESYRNGLDYDDINDPARRSAESVFLRCLHYPAGAAPGTVIAEPHTDHSGGTTHFFETTDGCEMLTLDEREWKPLPITEGGGVRFGGMQAQQFSRNEIKALCHRVVANETTAEIGRSAIVGFMPIVAPYIGKYDRERKGRTQDQLPGFNYDLNDTQLAEYFTK